MILTAQYHINNLRVLWIIKAKYCIIIIIVIKVKSFLLLEVCFMLVAFTSLISHTNRSNTALAGQKLILAAANKFSMQEKP